MADNAITARIAHTLTTAKNAIDAPALTQRNIDARSSQSYVIITRIDCARKSCDRQRNKRNEIAQKEHKKILPAKVAFRRAGYFFNN